MRLNSSGVNNENDVVGFRPPAPGRYHVVVKSVDESFEKIEAVIVEFEVLSGTVPGQKTLVHREAMFLQNHEPTSQILRFALVTGLLQAGTEADVDFQHAVGRQLVIGVDKRKSKKDDKEYTNISGYGLDMWSLNNPEVADVPRQPNPMERQQTQPPQQQIPPAQSMQPQQQMPAPAPPTQQAPPPSNPNNDWSGI